ncbi:hypothetical protein ES706_04889 [subsurface metagenome]
MAKQTAEIVPGEITQEQWDAKYDTTPKALKDLGGADSKDADDLPEGTANKYDTGVPPATQDDLPDGTTARQFLATEKTKLTGIEDEAKADQSGAEIRDAVIALGDTERKIVITEPQSGEFKVTGVHRNAAGNLEYDYDDVPEA